VTSRRLLVGVGICLIAFAARTYAGPAQDVLADLAESARAERVASGVVSLGVGVAIGVASAVFFLGTDYGLYGLIAGGIVAIPGAILLLSPSRAEREAAQSGDSEAAAALALERLADDGRRGRFLSGIGNVAAGVATLLYPINLITPYDSVYSAVASLGMAVYDFLVPSREEAAYDHYRALAEQGA
jgi:hypothetical protein